VNIASGPFQPSFATAQELFNPERQQAIFVDEIEKLIGNRAGGTWLTVPGFHGPD